MALLDLDSYEDACADGSPLDVRFVLSLKNRAWHLWLISRQILLPTMSEVSSSQRSQS